MESLRASVTAYLEGGGDLTPGELAHLLLPPYPDIDFECRLQRFLRQGLEKCPERGHVLFRELCRAVRRELRKRKFPILCGEEEGTEQLALVHLWALVVDAMFETDGGGEAEEAVLEVLRDWNMRWTRLWQEALRLAAKYPRSSFGKEICASNSNFVGFHRGHYYSWHRALAVSGGADGAKDVAWAARREREQRETRALIGLLELVREPAGLKEAIGLLSDDRVYARQAAKKVIQGLTGEKLGTDVADLQASRELGSRLLKRYFARGVVLKMELLYTRSGSMAPRFSIVKAAGNVR